MATLKVTIKEELVLNGKDIGNSNYIAISGVNNAEHRVVTLPQDSEKSLLLLDSAVAAGTIITNSLKFIRFTNLDVSNNIQLRFVTDTDGDQYSVRVEPGESYILGNDSMFAESTTSTENPTLDNASTINSGMLNIEAIYAMGVGGDCELEMFLATS